jgi:hypothetical protein
MKSSRAARVVGNSVAALLLSAAGFAHADEVQLQGGSVIEGRATRDGDTIVVKMEAGEIRLPAESVQHIKKSEASDDVAQRRRAALAPRDIKGRLELAAYCREHDLRATERSLLEEVIAIEPNQAEARRQLGYVRTEQGWVERSAQQQQARDAEHEAWLARERAREHDQVRADAEHERELTRQMQLDTERMREERLRARDEAPAYTYGSGYGYGYGYGYSPVYTQQRREPVQRAPAAEPCLPGGCAAAPPTATPISPIAGTRHPRDTTWALPGVRNPREWTR